MSKETILVVDDEEDLLELVRFSLAREGFVVICAASAEEALPVLNAQPPDLIVLDLMLPGMDGFTLARRIKNDAQWGRIPIVMISARSGEVDVVCGLEIGAADYVAKPFSPRVLVSRIRAVLRRHAQPEAHSANLIERQELSIDIDKHAVYVNGRLVDLTFTEFAILRLLASRPGWAFSRSQIVDAVRGYNYAVTDRSVDVQIVGLRRKLGRCGRYIETVRSVGYRFKEQNAKTAA